MAYEEVSFPSHDGLKLLGWFLPAKVPSTVTLIVQHGLGSNAGDMLMNSLCLAGKAGGTVSISIFAAMEEVKATSRPWGRLELRDLESAIAFLKRTKPEATRRLGIYGHSLGAAVAIVGAARHPELEAVIAESPFSRASCYGGRALPGSFTGSRRFRL